MKQRLMNSSRKPLSQPWLLTVVSSARHAAASAANISALALASE